MAREVLQGGDHPVGVRADKLHAPAGGEHRGAVAVLLAVEAAALDLGHRSEAQEHEVPARSGQARRGLNHHI